MLVCTRLRVCVCAYAGARAHVCTSASLCQCVWCCVFVRASITVNCKLNNTDDVNLTSKYVFKQSRTLLITFWLLKADWKIALVWTHSYLALLVLRVSQRRTYLVLLTYQSSSSELGYESLSLMVPELSDLLVLSNYCAVQILRFYLQLYTPNPCLYIWPD